MSRGRRPSAVPSVRWVAYIPADVAAKVELILTNPVRGKPNYGERGELMTALLQKWLKEQQTPAEEPPAPDSPAQST